MPDGGKFYAVQGLSAKVKGNRFSLFALETQVKAGDEDAAATFLLGYYYAMLGHKTEAISTLKAAVKPTPPDVQAKKLLYPLEEKEPPKDSAPARPPPGSGEASVTPAADQNLSAPVNSQSAVGDSDSVMIDDGGTETDAVE